MTNHGSAEKQPPSHLAGVGRDAAKWTRENGTLLFGRSLHNVLRTSGRPAFGDVRPYPFRAAIVAIKAWTEKAR